MFFTMSRQYICLVVENLSGICLVVENLSGIWPVFERFVLKKCSIHFNFVSKNTIIKWLIISQKIFNTCTTNSCNPLPPQKRFPNKHKLIKEEKK